jgi:superfamily I DNA and/or RNA helicase
MDECTKIFNVVYKVLMDHHLIRADHDQEKKKQDAFIVCKPMLKEIVEHNDTDLHQWLSKLFVQLNIIVDDKQTLNEIFSMILLEIQNLKDRLTEQESKVQSQELRIQTLELNQQMQDTNIKAFDIVNPLPDTSPSGAKTSRNGVPTSIGVTSKGVF